MANYFWNREKFMKVTILYHMYFPTLGSIVNWTCASLWLLTFSSSIENTNFFVCRQATNTFNELMFLIKWYGRMLLNVNVSVNQWISSTFPILFLDLKMIFTKTHSNICCCHLYQRLQKPFLCQIYHILKTKKTYIKII